MRLIDADALIKGLGFQGKGELINAFFVNNAIINQPTVDPVKHGKWVEIDMSGLTSQKWFNCSKCHKIATLPNAREWAFCPCCGARMDGKI